MRLVSLPLLVLAASVIHSLPGIAQQGTPAAACSTLRDAPRRRACEDSLVSSKIAGESSALGPRLWFTASYIDVDQVPTVLATLRASEGVNRSGASPRLNLRCKHKQLTAWVDWGQYLVSGTVVAFRFGNEKSPRSNSQLSSDHKASFFTGGVGPFIQDLLRNDRLVARATPYGENPITAVFILKGAGRALGPLQGACGS